MKLKKTIGTVISICLIAGFAMIPKAEAAWGVSQPENTTGAETDMKQYFELRFYDTYGTVTVCREYLEPVLGGKEPGISEYSAKASSGPEIVEDSTDTHLEETILESAEVPEPDIPEGCQFLGWLNCTGINEAELEAIYGDSLENNSYLCKDTGKVRAYLVNEDDLTEGPMDLYAAYASLDAEKDTNLEEAGTEENSNINIPVYAQADVIVESNIDHVLGDNAENYRYMEESGETGNITLYADMVIESPAWTEAIEHPEEYHMEYIEHPEEYHYEQKLIYQCNGCKEKFTSYEDARKHNKEQMLAGNFACGGHSSFMDDVKVVDKEAWTEEIKVVDKEAWTEYIEHEAGERRYLFTGWERFYGEGTEPEAFSKENVVTVTGPFNGAVYTAIYEEGHLVTYHYWKDGDCKPLYSIGISDERGFIDPETGEPYDTDAFALIKATLGTGQAFEGWQLVDQDGGTVPWEDFAAEMITQDMELYPVISQINVTDSAGYDLPQDAGNAGMRIYSDLKAEEPYVSVCFTDVYPQDSLSVTVSVQDYGTKGSFKGRPGVKANIYNKYVDDGNGDVSGDLIAEGVTAANGTVAFTFTGKLSISAESRGDSEGALLFEVARLNEDGTAKQTMNFCLKAGENITVTIPYGAYRVTEKDGWSWRHTGIYEVQTYIPVGVDCPEPDEGTMVHINYYDTSVICTNSEVNSKWFSATTEKRDIFRSEEQAARRSIYAE